MNLICTQLQTQEPTKTEQIRNRTKIWPWKDQDQICHSQNCKRAVLVCVYVRDTYITNSSSQWLNILLSNQANNRTNSCLKLERIQFFWNLGFAPFGLKNLATILQSLNSNFGLEFVQTAASCCFLWEASSSSKQKWDFRALDELSSSDFAEAVFIKGGWSKSICLWRYE